MTSTKYIGMDVHKESISIAVRNDAGKIMMDCVIETKANIILDFIRGLRGELQVTFEEGTWATWLYDLLKPHVTKLVVCDPRKNAKQGNKNDRIDARELADRLYMNKLSSVYHGGALGFPIRFTYDDQGLVLAKGGFHEAIQNPDPGDFGVYSNFGLCASGGAYKPVVFCGRETNCPTDQVGTCDFQVWDGQRARCPGIEDLEIGSKRPKVAATRASATAAGGL